jgi:hypothetical protein
MQRTLLLTALLAALTVPVGLAADTGDGTLSVKRGRGLVVLKLKGTVIGRVKSGRVQVKDFRPLDARDPIITGCKIRRIGPGISLCKGRNLGVRVDDGRFNVTVQGSGISISAVGRGPVAIDGAGETGGADGVLSVDDGPYESLPDEPTTLTLGTAPSRR